MTHSLAETLLRAQATASTIAPPSRGGGLTMDEAYRVGAAIARRRIATGWRFRGWKVGFTNRAMWERLGLDRPILAPVYRETVFSVTGENGKDERADEATLRPARHPHRVVPVGQRAALRIEVEVVVGMTQVAVGIEPHKPAPVWAAIGAELVDCHYPDWDFGPSDAVADFGLHAALVVGPHVELADWDDLVALRDVTARLSAWFDGSAGQPSPLPESEAWVETRGPGAKGLGPRVGSVEHQVLAEGTGRQVLGGPAKVVAALNGPLAEAAAVHGLTDDDLDLAQGGAPSSGSPGGSAPTGRFLRLRPVENYDDSPANPMGVSVRAGRTEAEPATAGCHAPATDRAGYLVSTGTLTPLVEAQLGTTYEVNCDLLPPFSFTLA